MDRNRSVVGFLCIHGVALRKESVDRNANPGSTELTFPGSLSARRAWIEISNMEIIKLMFSVALRKESVDRNNKTWWVDIHTSGVALRKESVDRNAEDWLDAGSLSRSLSARRAWIEILVLPGYKSFRKSLSARRAWIEMLCRILFRR